MTTSARVFIHPRCWSSVAYGAFQATLEERNFDINKIMIGPEDKRKRRELVRYIGQLPEHPGMVTFERMDGTRFDHKTGLPAPEAA